MKRYRLSQIAEQRGFDQVFSSISIGDRIYSGGLSFHTPGLMTHSEQQPHTHEDQEIFCLLQGEGWIDVDGVREPVGAGDVLVIEPGEDHHLISSQHNPLINLWLHANGAGHPLQFPNGDPQP